jgi:hypothetical protein
MRIFQVACAFTVAVGLTYAADVASAKPSSSHPLHGTVDVTAEPIDPPTEGACGAALVDKSLSDQQVADACQNDPAYNKWITDTTKGAPCTSGDSNVDTGTQVIIRSKAGKVLGTTKLSAGTLVKDQGEICRFQFAHTVGDAPGYEIAIGATNPVTFTKTELQRHGWLAALHYKST